MKRTFKQMMMLLFAALMLAQCAQHEDKTLRIRGKLTGVKDSLLFAITGVENGEPVFKDTTVCTKNGEFDLTISLDSVCLMEVIDGANDRNHRYVDFMLWLFLAKKWFWKATSIRDGALEVAKFIAN